MHIALNRDITASQPSEDTYKRQRVVGFVLFCSVLWFEWGRLGKRRALVGGCWRALSSWCWGLAEDSSVAEAAGKLSFLWQGQVRREESSFVIHFFNCFSSAVFKKTNPTWAQHSLVREERRFTDFVFFLQTVLEFRYVWALVFQEMAWLSVARLWQFALLLVHSEPLTSSLGAMASVELHPYARKCSSAWGVDLSNIIFIWEL